MSMETHLCGVDPRTHAVASVMLLCSVMPGRPRSTALISSVARKPPVAKRASHSAGQRRRGRVWPARRCTCTSRRSSAIASAYSSTW